MVARPARAPAKSSAAHPAPPFKGTRCMGARFARAHATTHPDSAATLVRTHRAPELRVPAHMRRAGAIFVAPALRIQRAGGTTFVVPPARLLLRHHHLASDAVDVE